jgi:DNA-binding CsgD family transcriptional regulator
VASSPSPLTEPERVLFCRLAVFLGGFDFDAAQVVACGGEVERYQVLDQLTLLVDKSLVVADDTKGRTRYRLLETVRQYALEKLGESGEADAVRTRHRDYYTALAALLDTPARTDYEQLLERAETEIDNLRAAFGWSRENSNTEPALALTSSLQPLWLARGRMREGRAWFDTILTDDPRHLQVAAAVCSRALADTAALGMWVGAADSMDQAQRALAIARDLDDAALLTRALTACGLIVTGVAGAETGRPYFAEAIGLARELNDHWRLSQILVGQALCAGMAGEPIAERAAAEEGRDLADAIGDRFDSRWCRWCLGHAQLAQGDLVGAVAQFGELLAEAEAAHDVVHTANGLNGLSVALFWQGQVSTARDAANAAVEAAAELGEYFAGNAYSALAAVALAAGDVDAAQIASEAALQNFSVALPQSAAVHRAHGAQVALASGDLTSARCWADDAVSVVTGWHLMVALTARARVAIAQGRQEDAERDAHDALACATDSGAYVTLPDLLECLAGLIGDAGSHHEAARLFGAAQAIGQRIGVVRFKIYEAGYQASVTALRDALGEQDFDAAWAEGAALSTEDAIAYAQRGRGQRKRPNSGWASLTPAERDVVRLVSEGLANNDIATRLFVSPRTVQTHLTHVYTKLGLSSRVQLAQEAARRA